MEQERPEKSSTKGELDKWFNNKVLFTLYIILFFIAPIAGIVVFIVLVSTDTYFDGIIGIIMGSVYFLLAGIIILASVVYEKMEVKDHLTSRKIIRQRRKQIRELGLDQLENEEEGITVEEFEERYRQRQARQQATERRRPPVIELLNESPGNDAALKRMTYKGAIKGKKCGVCKLDIRKKQKVVQCPYCLNLFHYDHLNDWFKSNKDCPVCDKAERGAK